MDKIFILEDDVNIASIIDFNLRAAGFDTLLETDGAAGLARLKEGGADLMILDVMLPSMSGFEVLRALRKTSDIPVIILSARDSEEDKLEGLSLMADDYVTKPFSVSELIARVRVNLARARSAPPAPKGLSVSADGLVALRDGREIPVTRKEYDILSMLIENRGKVLSREQILERVWGYNGFLGDTHTVDVAIRRLREKVEDDPSDPKFILSRRGSGYYLP